MDKVFCSFQNCKYRRKNHGAEYFVYVKNDDVEKSKNSSSDVGIPHKGMIDFHLLRHGELGKELKGSFVQFSNQIDLQKIDKFYQKEYTRICFCKFHAPIESSYIKDVEKTKKDIFEDIKLLEEFNQHIHKDISEWNLHNQNLLEQISATEDVKEKVRISRKLKNLDLKALCFPGDIDFTQHGDLRIEPYSNKIDLSKCRFEAKASFAEVCFDNLVCDNTYFKGQVDFRGCKFRLGASFKDCIFYESAVMRGEYSGNPACFDRATFKRHVDFMWSRFKNQTSFEGSIFEDRADFMQATFSGGAVFKETHFYKASQFAEVIFERFAFFDGSIFRDWATFKNSKFTQGASYRACLFDTGDFLNARFDGQLVFDESTFKADAFFHYADDRNFWGDEKNDAPGTTFRYVSFENVHFLGRANFTNRDFLYITSFKNTVFHKAPQFYNSALHQGTNFSGAKFLDIESDWAEMSYRTLKIAAENLNSRRDEDLFFSLEQRSILYQFVYKKLINSVKRLWKIAINPFDPESNSIETSYSNENNSQRYDSSVPSWIDLFLSFLYQVASNYGRSIGRNLTWIIILTLISAGCYFYWFQISSSFSESLIFSLKQIFRPFFIYSEKPALGLGITLFATLQTIAHLVLVTMLVFAVRRRLSIK